MTGWLALLGRFLFGGFFVYSGVLYFTNFEGILNYSNSKTIPYPEFSMKVSGILLIVGGLIYLLGWRTKIGGVILLLFLIPTTLFVHRFWNEANSLTYQLQLSYFLRNIAFAGAILMSFRYPTLLAFNNQVER